MKGDHEFFLKLKKSALRIGRIKQGVTRFTIHMHMYENNNASFSYSYRNLPNIVSLVQ